MEVRYFPIPNDSGTASQHFNSWFSFYKNLTDEYPFGLMFTLSVWVYVWMSYMVTSMDMFTIAIVMKTDLELRESCWSTVQ
jgi:hypothetical protein